MPRLPPHGNISDGNSSSRYGHFVQEVVHEVFDFSFEEALHEKAGPDPHLICFIITAGTYAFLAATFICVFSFLRVRFPLVYQSNALIGAAPSKLEGSFFCWIPASLSMTSEQVTNSAGLDATMMLEFTILGRRIMLLIGLPMLFILAPLNYYFGTVDVAGSHIHYLSIQRAKEGGWLDWAHAAMVWYAISVVEANLHWTRACFLTRRYRWLRELPAVCANTVMLQGIPPELRTDSKLADFFNKIFAGKDSVQRAYVTRKTDALLQPWRELIAARDALHEAEATWKKNQETGKGRPMTGLSCFGLREKVDSIEHYRGRIAELTPQVATERSNVLEGVAREDTSSHLGTGFVTFNHRVHRELALNVQRMYLKEGQLVTWIPPHPKDVIWDGLVSDPHSRKTVNALGYVLIFSLLLAYMPLVVGITSLAELINAGPFQPIWEGVAPTLGMTIMNSFLPTFLLLIITNCFPLRSMARVQHELQYWYFAFLVFLVLLAAAVGQSVLLFIKTLVDRPAAVFALLADSMPAATTFYLNLVVLEWTSDAMHLLRLPELVKFLLWGQIFDEQKAKELSEPEDQDFCGIGARSAHQTISVAIGIVFCTLSPLIGVLCAGSMMLKRLVYGYLMVFAETRKPDLGGSFWVTKLQGLYIAILIYTILMTGVLYRRSPLGGPALLAAPSILYVLWSKHNFDEGLQWTTLPMCDVAELEDPEESSRPLKRSEAEDSEYIQPELLPEGRARSPRTLSR